MTQAPISFATLPNHTLVDVAGYSWMTVRRDDGSTELSPSGEPRLPDVSIVERPGDNGTPTYLGTVRATDLYELAAHRDGFATPEAAVAWATGFEFATRQAGGLTWHAVIGSSVAEIVSYELGGSPSYAVKRRLKLGTQSVEFSITDLAYRETPKSIVSFEQASAIALTMPDYVMELMRVAADANQAPGPAA